MAKAMGKNTSKKSMATTAQKAEEEKVVKYTITPIEE